jgi:hypothetical protein
MSVLNSRQKRPVTKWTVNPVYNAKKSTGAPTAATSKEAAAAETTDRSTLSLSGHLNSLDGVAAAEGRYVYFLPLCIPFNF